MDSPHLLIILEILLYLLGIAILTLGYIISFHELRRPFIKCSEMRQWNMQNLFSPPLIDCSLFSCWTWITHRLIRFQVSVSKSSIAELNMLCSCLWFSYLLGLRYFPMCTERWRLVGPTRSWTRSRWCPNSHYCRPPIASSTYRMTLRRSHRKLPRSRLQEKCIDIDRYLPWLYCNQSGK